MTTKTDTIPSYEVLWPLDRGTGRWVPAPCDADCWDADDGSGQGTIQIGGTEVRFSRVDEEE